MYHLSRLVNPLQALAYQHLTFPAVRSHLRHLNSTDPVVAIAATVDGQPAGLAIATQANQSAMLLSIFVQPQHRRQGIGAALLQAVEQELAKNGCDQIQIIYVTSAQTPGLERLLAKYDWTQPTRRMIVCKVMINQMADQIMSNPRAHRHSQLPSAYQLLPWKDITEGDRQLLQRPTANPWIPPDLHPCRYEQNFEPINSVGLKYHGQLVGWLMTHRLDQNTIRYTSAYVRPDLQKMARTIPVYIHAVQLQKQAHIPRAVWTVPVSYPTNVNFMLRYTSNCLESLEESRVSQKNITRNCRLLKTDQPNLEAVCP
jgi:GNAT superfamily N-acetyltransferase